MAREKKLIDLIYLDEGINESQLKTEYQARISTWEKWSQHRQDDDLTLVNTFVTEQAEYYSVSAFLTTFLRKRLDWIFQSISDQDLRLKYLLVLPPFSQKGNIKSFLLHFYQLKDHERQNNIVFQSLNKQERELRVLWDMYKLTKTLETIQTLKKWLVGRHPFPSYFSGKHALKTLNNLQECLVLLFRICIKSEYQSKLLKQFPKDVFSAETVLKRRESENYLVTDITLDKLDYRNYFFFIYYRSSLKANFEGQTLEFEINYLDYEIIRQEFLTHWISQRLKNNPAKLEVLNQYMFGSKTFAQMIEKRPDMEISLLKKLPKNVFDDLIAQVNDSVEGELKLEVDPMSETFGEFARQLFNFEKAKELAKKSVQAIRNYVIQTKKPGAKAITPRQNEIKPEEISLSRQKKRPSEFKIQILKKNEIGFPFFCSNNAHFSRLHKLLKSKLEHNVYVALNTKIEAFLSQTTSDRLIIRRSPRHEWAVPFLVHETENSESKGQLLILGAELKARPKGSGNSTGTDHKYEFRSYFVYGTEEKIGDMGFISEDRKVKGEIFYIYDFSHPAVIRQALKLIDVVTEPESE